MIKWKSHCIVFVMMGIGLIVAFFLMTRQSDFINSLEEITKDKSFDIQVDDAYNEKGIYILNNKYHINSATFVVGNHYGYSKDDAIWRPKNSKYNPRISDISAPFRIYKDINIDTLKLIKNDKTILLILEND